MSRKQKHIELNASERLVLEEGYRTGSSHLYRSHCQAILLSDTGMSIKGSSKN